MRWPHVHWGIWISALVVGVAALAWFFWGRCTKTGPQLPAGVKILIQGNVLDPPQTDRFKNLLAQSCTAAFSTRSRADIQITVIFPDGRNEDLSCFSRERVLYFGHDIDAWTEDMSDARSTGYKLNDEFLHFINAGARQKTIETSQ